MATLTFLPADSYAAAPGTRPGAASFATVLGFFFIFRTALTFLFFQSNPVAGTACSIAVAALLLYASLLGAAGPLHGNSARLLSAKPNRWILALLGFSLLSVAWTGASSAAIALTYWIGIATDVVLVGVLLRGSEHPLHITEALLKGVVFGGSALGVIAWLAPATPDMRLGDNTFLHPNFLSLQLGLAALCAVYRVPLGRRWAALAAFVSITLLRTLSKTSILAFAIAAAIFLLRHEGWSRRKKLAITSGALVVLTCFSGLLLSYFETYNSSGNQVETLTGRTVLWATVASMGVQSPWVGHGIDSFRALVPSFGAFSPVHAHNEFLQQFFEGGVVAVALTLGLFVSFFRQLRDSGGHPLRSLALSLWIFALIRGLTDTVSYGLSLPLWMIVALSVCLHSKPAPQVIPA